MPEHPARGPSRRSIAAAILVPAAAVAAIFTASSMASGTTASPVQQPTEPLPTEFSPPGDETGTPGGATTAPTGTGTATRTPTRTATPTGTGTGVVPPGTPGTMAVSCVRATATPTQTGTGVVPGPTGTRTTGPTGTRTGGPTGTATGPTAPTGGTAPDVVPGAAQTETGTPTGTHTTQPGAEATILRLGDAGGKSNVIVDEDGCALYLNTEDTEDTTAVDQGEESTWIPIPAPARVDSPGLEQGDVGTFTRPDGQRQATYKGHQLYRFVGDRAPQEAKGQGVDGVFFLVGQNGEPAR